MKKPQQILFPEIVLQVRAGFRSINITLRPLSLRQIELVKLGLADALETCTGLSRKQLRKLMPITIAELSNRVNMINAWDPVALAKELEKENLNEETAESIEDFAAELIAAGHRENEIWDYWPEKFCFYLQQARRARKRRELIEKKSFTEAACTAVGRFSNEGNKYAQTFVKSLAEEIRKLDGVKP